MRRAVLDNPRCGIQGAHRAAAQAAKQECASRAPASAHSPTLQSRAQTLAQQEIAFIPNASFLEKGPAESIRREIEAVPNATGCTAKIPDGTPACSAALYATPLLTAAEQLDLFRRMNFLKFLANASRSKLDPGRPDRALVEQIEALLEQARSVRNWLVQANLRLVVSIGRRLADQYYPFDDVVSDGNLALLRAVEKFDYARGFRFSTYATHVIQRELYRHSGRRRQQERRMAAGADGWLANAPDERGSRDPHGEAFDRWQRLLSLMHDELDDRDQFILARRLGLDLELGPQTLQSIGQQLGISKERVRQLEMRAIARLQHAAAEGTASPDITAVSQSGGTS